MKEARIRMAHRTTGIVLTMFILLTYNSCTGVCDSRFLNRTHFRIFTGTISEMEIVSRILPD
jgi:hypothetical protein